MFQNLIEPLELCQIDMIARAVEQKGLYYKIDRVVQRAHEGVHAAMLTMIADRFLRPNSWAASKKKMRRAFERVGFRTRNSKIRVYRHERYNRRFCVHSSMQARIYFSVSTRDQFGP